MKSAQNSQILQRQSLQFKKAISITSNANTKSSDPSLQISETFAKLHDTIDNLDSKVNLLLQKHEAQFLFAWRNHIKKIKKQLYDIKQRADQKQKQLNSNQRMVAMEKQMMLFRDQSLRLYEQVQQKKGEVQIFRRKVKEQQSQLFTLRQQNKQLIKNIKLSQAKHFMAQQRIQQLQKQLLKYQQTDGMQHLRLSAVNKISLYSNFTKENFNKSQHRKTIGFEAVKEFEKSVQKGSLVIERMKKFNSVREQHLEAKDAFHIPTIKIQKLNRLSVTTAKQNKRTQSLHGDNNDNHQNNLNQKQIISKTNNNNYLSLIQDQKSKTQYRTSFVMIEPKVYETDLKNWFLDCIKSIKKQISSRKIGFSSTSNDILKVQSLQEFKTIDKLRLLEMFLQNQKLLNHMYQKIFPDRMKQIEGYLQSRNHAKQSKNISETKNKSTLTKVSKIVNDQLELNKTQERDEKIEQYLKNSRVKNDRTNQNNSTKIRVKSVSKASKSQPIRNRIIMKDGKLGLMC